ncbi:MAG: transcriptional regulator [Gammaproteobacteria bacterium]|nr:transcriptional regulator [Gammaproteobacteria bacterium]MDE0478762.1 transcriptional regulator [Gammaproteobacteria bacterium]MYA35739.1 transcriptional regulator [Gammaproteobacteria bacterium]MYH85550.1 transcriptional regulator [Gammaproteobacteria bacterium]MYK05531.1 transcriptional regulator [Gammaproteobacteria bacterium]
MEIKPIKTEADYQEALKLAETLMAATPDTPEGDRLDNLVTLIEAYESKRHPVDFPDSLDAIKFEMENKGITAKNRELGIPAESLIKPVRKNS